MNKVPKSKEFYNLLLQSGSTDNLSRFSCVVLIISVKLFVVLDVLSLTCVRDYLLYHIFFNHQRANITYRFYCLSTIHKWNILQTPIRKHFNRVELF